MSEHQRVLNAVHAFLLKGELNVPALQII